MLARVAGDEVASEVEGEDIAGRQTPCQGVGGKVLVQIKPEYAVPVQRRRFENFDRFDA